MALSYLKAHKQKNISVPCSLSVKTFLSQKQTNNKVLLTTIRAEETRVLIFACSHHAVVFVCFKVSGSFFRGACSPSEILSHLLWCLCPKMLPFTRFSCNSLQKISCTFYFPFKFCFFIFCHFMHIKVQGFSKACGINLHLNNDW